MLRVTTVSAVAPLRLAVRLDEPHIPHITDWSGFLPPIGLPGYGSKAGHTNARSRITSPSRCTPTSPVLLNRPLRLRE